MYLNRFGVFVPVNLFVEFPNLNHRPEMHVYVQMCLYD